MQAAKQIVLRYIHALRFASVAPNLLSNSTEARKVRIKADRTPVTKTDKEIDRILREWIIDKFPEDAICSEEGTKELDRNGWFIDSLDGTANFANERLDYAVSIGYWIKDRPAFGIIVTPGLNGFSIISALKGHDIRINGKKLQLSAPQKLMGGIDFRRTEPDLFLDLFPKLLEYTGENKVNDENKTNGEIRVIGSIARGLTEVALGKLSFYIHSGPRIWDVAAGLALLKVSRGVTNLEKIDLISLASKDYRLPMMVAAQTRTILSEVLGIISQI